jgi:hypothetical protein
MKTELKPENRALFDAGREGLAPTDDDRARVAKALGLNLGGGVGIASAATKAIAGSAATSPAAFGISSGIVAAKWVVVVAVVVGVGTGGAALYRAGTARERSQPAAVSVGAELAREPSPPRAAGGARAQVVGEEQPPAATQVVGAEQPPAGVPRASTTPASLDPTTESPKPADVAPARRVSTSTLLRAPQAGEIPPRPSEPSSAPSPAATAASSPGASPSAGALAGNTSVRVAEEAHLLREADAALRGGDTAGAARWLADHARLFPDGVLAEERDVQRVLVLCAAGQADAARTEASRFLSAYPRSLLAGRVRASCGAP